MLASRPPVLRSDSPLSDDQTQSRSSARLCGSTSRNTFPTLRLYPTVTVQTELRKEGFQPFMVTQARTHHEDRRDFTKHMIGYATPARSMPEAKPTKSFC